MAVLTNTLLHSDDLTAQWLCSEWLLIVNTTDFVVDRLNLKQPNTTITTQQESSAVHINGICGRRN